MKREYIEKSRLKLQMDKTIRELNRDAINPRIPELRIEDIEPFLSLIARTRAAYLEEIFTLTKAVEKDSIPSKEQLDHLKSLRETFEELLKASSSLDTAIERGYLDVTS